VGQHTVSCANGAPHTATLGWALKSSGVRSRFSSKQKDYIIQAFNIGELTGRKIDPATVAKEMRSAKTETGERIFSSSEFLTQQQIASLFSRLASKKGLGDNEDEANIQAAEKERGFHEILQEIEQQVALCHPIIYGTHNICDLSSKSKLSKFSIKMLQEICNYFELPISHVKCTLKKPFIKILDEMVKLCSCNSQ
jgi:hypothetical protein